MFLRKKSAEHFLLSEIFCIRILFFLLEINKLLQNIKNSYVKYKRKVKLVVGIRVNCFSVLLLAFIFLYTQHKFYRQQFKPLTLSLEVLLAKNFQRKERKEAKSRKITLKQ